VANTFMIVRDLVISIEAIPFVFTHCHCKEFLILLLFISLLKFCSMSML
jgi:hypothetical protein